MKTFVWLLAGLAWFTAAAPVVAQEGRTVPVVAARIMRNGWGVVGRPGVDAPAAAFASMLAMIGTRDIRSPLVMAGARADLRWRELQQAMQQAAMADPVPRFTALVGGYLNDPRTTWFVQQQALLDVAGTGLLRAVEGPNELNNPAVGGGSHGPDDHVDRTGAALYGANFLGWARALHDFQLAHAAALAGVVFVAPSIASGEAADYARLPNLSGLVGAGNLHFYAGGGRQPSFSQPPNPAVGSFETVLGWARAAELPAGPMWLTETGASTSGNYARDGVSQAKYLANQMFDFFAVGGARLFIYCLVDGSGVAGDVEGNFGLFRRDGTPKPAAVMLSELKDLLSLGRYDDPRNERDRAAFVPGFDAAALRLSWTGEPPGGTPRVLVLPKSDGSTLMAVWNEPRVDDGAGREIAPPALPVAVDFGSVQRFRVHELVGAPGRGVGSVETGAGTTVVLTGGAVVIELGLAG